MRTEDQIAALQALLARIRSRSRAPRIQGGIGSGRPTAPGLAAYADAEGRGSASGWSDIPSSANVWEENSPRPNDETNVSPSEPDERTIQEHPVPAIVVKVTPPSAELLEMAAADPPPMEVIELEIDEPSVLPPSIDAEVDAFESRSRLMIAPSVAAIPEDDAPDDDTLIPELEAIEEPAPSSSRRPISVEEKLKQLAEDDDAVHAAPPESGKLLAAPILNLEEPDVADLRIRHADRAVAPDVTRVTLDYADVAAFDGKSAEKRAATFGELLDAAMSL